MWRSLVLSLALFVPAAEGADLRSVSLERRNGVYTMHLLVWFDARIDAVYNVFLDWELSEQFSSVIVEARNTGSDAAGDRGFYIRNRACVLLFCRSVERHGAVEHEPPTFIRATADPERSDFHRSDESWEFTEDNDGTLMTYWLEIRPKFWVPPLIGPYVLRRKIRADGVAALERIEYLAQHWAPRADEPAVGK